MSEGVAINSLRDVEWSGHLEEAWKQLDREQRRELVTGLNDHLQRRNVAQAKALLRGKAERVVRSNSLFSFSSRWTVNWLRDEILTLVQCVVLLWLAPFHLAFGCSTADWFEVVLVLLLFLRWSLARRLVVSDASDLCITPPLKHISLQDMVGCLYMYSFDCIDENCMV